MNDAPTQPIFDFLSNGGEMGALMRAKDWDATSLGLPHQWPETLKTTLRLVLTSNHPMFIWWGKDLVQFYNDAYRQTMGPERHPSALGQKARECWEEIWHIIGPQIESVMDAGGATWHEDQLVPVTRHGRREDVWWTYGYSPIQDSSGVRGVLVVCNDVTKEHTVREELKVANAQLVEQLQHRDKVERALAAQRQAESERLQSLFRQAPGFMCILRGPTHIYEFVNAAYQRLVGQRDLLGKTVLEAVPEASGQGFITLLDDVFTNARPYSANAVALSLKNPGDDDFSTCYLDFVYQPIFNTDGSVSGIFVEGFDATERVLTRQALETSELRLKEGLVAARMAVWDWDLVTKRVNFSENTPTVFGGNWHHIDHVWKSIEPADMARLHAARDEAIAQRGTYEELVRLIRPDDGGILWLQVHGRVICDADGVPRSIRGVSIDVTARKAAEEALREADRRKDEFLAMLAHELRNPLAPISAAAQLLGLVSDEPQRVKQASEVIARQVGHMSSLLDDLLDVSRVTTGLVALEKQVLDMRQIALESIEQVRPFFEQRRHHFSFRADLASCMVMGDHMRLVQVITNVLQNAAKYTNDGGHITLTMEEHESEVAVRVQDNGMGIDAGLLPHIFELFTQERRSSDRSQGGLGLGLALVRSLLALHDGRITAVSDGIGKGALFTIFLPRINVDAGPVQAQGLDAGTAAGARALKLLVVDDNIDAANVLAMFLQACGHTVVVEHDARAAIAQARTGTHEVFLLDIGLPGLDGNELARQIRSIPESSAATLVAVTGYGQEHDKEKALAAGFDHFFVKPIKTDKLVQLLSQLQRR